MKKFSIGELIYYLKCFPYSSKSSLVELETKNNVGESVSKTEGKPGGWKSMPYIIANETFEKLATLGLLANFTVYLQEQFHMKKVFASNVLYIWAGFTNIAPLIGAFLSDAYLGRFRTIAYSSTASFLGMGIIMLTAMIPKLRPQSCNLAEGEQLCRGPTRMQFGILCLGLGFLTIGAGGIRPCSLPFGADQFDPTTEKGRKGMDSFFNWYYFTFTASMMIALTVVVYIQQNISWSIGLGIPTLLMLWSIILFFIGTKLYIYVPPKGSVFSSIAHVTAASFMKHKLVLPSPDEQQKVLYDPPLMASIISKLPLTQQFRFLNKAAIIEDADLSPDGSAQNCWNLCSIQEIEEFKCLIRIVPIWASGIICFVAMSQQSTFLVYQAQLMDRHLGTHFQIPPGSLGVISMLALTFFIPIYDRLLIPAFRLVTHHRSGITLLQRMGTGLLFAILSMFVAALVEKKRRDSAISHGSPHGIAPLTVLWLAPQLILLGVAEAFNAIGQIEFYYKQFPEHMRSIASSLFFCSLGGSNYLSSLVVSIVHNYTGKHGQPNWLDNDLNKAKLDYFYYVLAGMGVINLVYFVVCAHFYRYKGSREREEEDVSVVIEMKPQM